MGCDRQITCLTCRVNYYLGYGSYLTWTETLGEFEAAPNERKPSNMQLRKILEEHEGHELKAWSYDYCFNVGDDLYIYEHYLPDRLFIRGFSGFRQVDMTEESPDTIGDKQ